MRTSYSNAVQYYYDTWTHERMVFLRSQFDNIELMLRVKKSFEMNDMEEIKKLEDIRQQIFNNILSLIKEL